MSSRTYRFGRSTLTLQFGDITTSSADVVVSSDDFMLTMGGGVSAAIRHAAGEALILDASKKTPAKLGDIVVTTAGALPAKHVFHAITIDPRGKESDAKSVISAATRRCLNLMDTLSLQSIAFPAIGAGVAGFDYDDVAAQMADVIAADFRSRSRPIEVTIYLFDRFRSMTELDFIRFFEEFAARAREVPSEVLAEATDGAPQTLEAQVSPGSEEQAAQRDVGGRQDLLMRLGLLGQERCVLERRLVELKGGLSNRQREGIQERLQEIHHLRLDLLSGIDKPPKSALSMFISYAHEDEALRIALGKHLRALERQGLIESWHDRMITPGKEWEAEIDANLDGASVVLLLVSADFVNSEYCYGREMKLALERHEARQALVIPVILRPVVWSMTPFAKIQALPSDGRAVTTWDDRDSALVNVTEGVRAAIADLARQRD